VADLSLGRLRWERLKERRHTKQVICIFGKDLSSLLHQIQVLILKILPVYHRIVND